MSIIESAQAKLDGWAKISPALDAISKNLAEIMTDALAADILKETKTGENLWSFVVKRARVLLKGIDGGFGPDVCIPIVVEYLQNEDKPVAPAPSKPSPTQTAKAPAAKNRTTSRLKVKSRTSTRTQADTQSLLKREKQPTPGDAQPDLFSVFGG